jgi:hypothetical protein
MRMAAANPLWGAPRIHGELLKLGLDVAERTVSRLMPKRSRPPSQTWRTFLTNHVQDLVSIDFFTVPTVRLRVLFVLVVLAHHRRRVLHFNVTAHPTATWTAQQIVDTFPDDTAPSYLRRDRDQIYGDSFQHRVKGMRIREVVTATQTRLIIVDSPPFGFVLRRLSRYNFRANEVRLLLGVIAYNLGNLLRRLVLPLAIQNWSLTSLQQRLFKTGGRLIRHARYFVLQLAESYLTSTLFRQILGRIARLGWHPT